METSCALTVAALGRLVGDGAVGRDVRQSLFFDGWSSIARTLLVGTLAYVFMVVMLRLSGKRTLSKMNAFDFIVTIALGSALATVLLDNSDALEGVRGDRPG